MANTVNRRSNGHHLDQDLASVIESEIFSSNSYSLGAQLLSVITGEKKIAGDRTSEGPAR